MHPPEPNTADLWQRLITYLNEWGTAREVPGGIEVTFEGSDGGARTVEVVMSPSDWEEFVGTMYGDADPYETGIQEVVLGTPHGMPYLVYSNTYAWNASETRELPVADLPDAGPGEWLVVDKDGKVVSRFADFDDPN